MILGHEDIEKRMKATFMNDVVATAVPNLAGKVQFDNAKGSFAEREHWVRLTIKPGEVEHAEMGGPLKNTWRYFGLMIVSFFAPFGTGNAVLNAFMDQCAAVYRGREVDEILYETFKKEVIGRRDHWWQVNGTATYFCELIA